MRWPCLVCGKPVRAQTARGSWEVGDTLYALHARCERRLKTAPDRLRVPFFLEVTPPTGPAGAAQFHRNSLIPEDA